MAKIPNPTWTQPNTSDKYGNVWASMNMNFDETGYIKLSPRSVNLFDDSADTSNLADTDFDTPVAFGRYGFGTFRIATTDEPFNLTLSDTAKTIAEDAGSNNPNLTSASHGVWWQNRWYTSTATTVSYNSSGTWTADAITSLTSGKRHYMEVFKNRNELCVSNGNVLKQYNTSHSGTTDLTIPSDFEIVGLAYNNNKMGVITRLGSDSAGQNANAYLFIWNGSTTSAQAGYDLGATQAIAIAPYKSSFVVLDSEGKLQYYNGGGLEILAQFPFYNEEGRVGDFLNFIAYGTSMVSDGDILYINIHFDIDSRGAKRNRIYRNNPSGIWCYDPRVGLYHRYSPSISQTYMHTITEANVNTTTNVFTTSSTLPATGNPVLLTNGTVGGLVAGKVYWLIKVSSTTFKLATTKANAEVETAIDITSADTTQFFWMYDLKDYGQIDFGHAGAVQLLTRETFVYRDIIWGANLTKTDATSSLEVMGVTVPSLENRGFIITPKIFSQEVTDKAVEITVKFRPLDTNDKIIIKAKTRDVFGLYTCADSATKIFNWTSPREGYSAADFTEAQSYFDIYGNLEMTFILGTGAGQSVQVTDMTTENGTTSFVLTEDVIGASSGLASYCYLDNWEKITEIDSDLNNQGFLNVTTDLAESKFVQYKLELRGYATTIEEIEPIIRQRKQSR